MEPYMTPQTACDRPLTSQELAEDLFGSMGRRNPREAICCHRLACRLLNKFPQINRQTKLQSVDGDVVHEYDWAGDIKADTWYVSAVSSFWSQQFNRTWPGFEGTRMEIDARRRFLCTVPIPPPYDIIDATLRLEDMACGDGRGAYASGGFAYSPMKDILYVGGNTSGTTDAAEETL